MADRIIKGDSGNDVVIQNNAGSRKIEVTDSGDVEITGDVKTTTVKATNLKANDGTAGLSVADSTGRVTFSENNPVITLGSNASGFTGIKALDIYQIASHTGTGDIAHGNFTRGTSASGCAVFGSAMTLHNETAGVFTFPSTGIWKIESNIAFFLNGVDRIIQVFIQIAPDGKTGTYVTRGYSFANIHKSVTTTYQSSYGFCYTDVTDTDASSGTAVKFRVSCNNASTATGVDSNALLSAVTFTRMGDT